MSRARPLSTEFPLRALKHQAVLRGAKIEAVPPTGSYIGLEQIQSWTGQLSGTVSSARAEGAANAFRAGDVLFSKLRPYLAKGWLADHNGFCTTEALVLRPQGDARFLRYCLLTKEVIDSIDSSTYGAKMPRADWGYIGNVELPCPSAGIQTDIANYLDTQTAAIDALIAKKEELLRVLDRYRQAVIEDAVTRGVTANHELSRTKCEWLSFIPSHWALTRAKNVFKERSTKGLSGEEQLAASQVLGVVPRSMLDFKTMESMSADQAGYKLVLPGDFVISLRSFEGGFEYSEYRGVISPAYTVFYPTRKIHSPYFKYLFKSQRYVTALGLHKKGIRDGQTVPFSGFKNDFLPIPPIAEQVEIANYVAVKLIEIDRLSAHGQSCIDSLTAYRTSVVSAAVTGKLEIPTQ